MMDTIKIKTDYHGRVEGWKPITKKPIPYFISVGAKACSKCGKLYFDSWSAFCCLDGKWLIHTEVLDKEHRNLLGLEDESPLQKLSRKQTSSDGNSEEGNDKNRL